MIICATIKAINLMRAGCFLYRVTKPGGVVVWVIGDKINGGRTLTSFDHAFAARKAGFVVHDVMIYQKNTPFMRSNAYTNCFMMIFTKGPPQKFHPLKVPTKRHGIEMVVHNKGPDAINRKIPVELKKEKTRTNIWQYAVGQGGSTCDKIASIRQFSRKNWMRIIFCPGAMKVM